MDVPSVIASNAEGQRFEGRLDDVAYSTRSEITEYGTLCTQVADTLTAVIDANLLGDWMRGSVVLGVISVVPHPVVDCLPIGVMPGSNVPGSGDLVHLLYGYRCRFSGRPRPGKMVSHYRHVN